MPKKVTAGINSRVSDSREVRLRVRVVAPPAGILFCIQGKPNEFLRPTRSKDDDLVFETVVRVADAAKGKPPRLLGRSVQGPPAGRFLYICSGTYAGETSTPWARRAKVPLSGVTSGLITRGIKKGALQATIAGTGSDGGPACGTVPLVRDWTAVP